jgi:pimeloyl-ACP methyl ester carboxylesterase
MRYNCIVRADRKGDFMPATETKTGPTEATRQKVYFRSGEDRCAAWFYPGTNGACVVMAGGLAVTKEPGTDPFAGRFNEAGFSVLAFDYRRLGESGGGPRQVVRLGDQQEDFANAVEFVRTLPEVDPSKVAIWGFSASGGHVFPVAARDPKLGVAIAVSALADGPATAPNAFRHTTPLSGLRITGRGILDGIGGLFGRDPLLVPLAGERGTVASLTTPDSLNGSRALNPGNRYPDWQQEVSAWSGLRLGFYRPARFAPKVGCPLLALVAEGDGVAPPKPLIRAAERARHGEVARIPGGHYEPFLDGHERAVEIQLEFLRRHLVDG